MQREFKILADSINELTKEFQNFKNHHPQSSKDELMTRQEVANFFKIDLSTLHHWTKEG